MTVMRSPAPVSPAESMFWLFQSLPLIFCLGPGNVVSQSSSSPLVMNGTLLESVTLPLNLPSGEKVIFITWLYNGVSIAFIQPSEKPTVQVTNPKWRKQLNFTESYSLCLKNLTGAEAGSYSAQITTETSVMFSNYTLRIFGQLKNLQVTNHIQLSENRTCEIHLTCSVENPDDDVSFRWQTPGNMYLSEPNLTISWDPRNASEQKYTCIAENPANNLSLTVFAQELCEGIFDKESGRWGIPWIIPLTLSIIVVISVVIIFCWNKRGSLYLSTQQTQSPESPWDIGDTSTYPGSTVYAQVTHPNQVNRYSFVLHNCHCFSSHLLQSRHYNHLTAPNEGERRQERDCKVKFKAILVSAALALEEMLPFLLCPCSPTG
ncbi:SLAM family member 6 isoform X2 [Ochotona curzoniae]|uniref:SLAM family member 6 isoform X2 n=1 Tax=Ochotona curzoniae TaxID=130825 RepID=UPI001B34A996|nr:SLAM family member 6 isoform X2 [Ochotona curzoniae]